VALHTKQQDRIKNILALLHTITASFRKPASALVIEKFGRDPFLILVSCLLSLRTKDVVSFPASCRLFEQAKTAQQLSELSLATIEMLIYPVGFYRRKSHTIKLISLLLIKEYQGSVPASRNQLCALPGVGPKTANLVLAEAFKIPAICVDVHVHRISNRLGLVKSRTPEETEKQLTSIVPQKDWISLNSLFVMWGQNICVPTSPLCSQCPLSNICPKIGVIKKR
jgi:endonuclease-3